MDIPILFGRFLVRECNVSERDMREAVMVQSEINRAYSSTALEGGFITLDDFKNALGCQRQKGIRFREALAELKIADETIKNIDSAHKEKSVKLGELLVTRGIITEADLEEALKKFMEKGHK